MEFGKVDKTQRLEEIKFKMADSIDFMKTKEIRYSPYFN